MSRMRIYARNLLSNWFGQGASLVVLFFLTPFVIAKLGDVRYGIWVLLMSVTGYLGLLELGVRGSTGRFINFYIGRGDRDKVNGVVSASLIFYTVISVVVLCVATMLGLFATTLFPKIPSELADEARWMFVMLGANLWLGFYNATFMQLLKSNDRFDLINVAELISLAVRSTAFVILLKMGYGLVALALTQFASTVLRLAVLVAFNRSYGTPVSLGLRWVNREVYREIFGVGFWVLICSLCTQVISYLNPILITWMLGLALVTFYNLANMLALYGNQFLTQVVGVLNPEIIKRVGRGDLAGMQWLVIRSANVTMFFAAPVLVGFMVFGREFFALWVGERFEAVTGTVLFILTIPTFMNLATRGCGVALMGLGHYRFIALISVLEAIANVALSIVLVKVFDMWLYGIAVGTALPKIIFTTGILPVYAWRTIGLRFSDFIRQSLLRWAPAALIFAGLSVGVQMLWPAEGWIEFFPKVIGLVVVYVPIGYLLVLRTSGGPMLPAPLAPLIRAVSRLTSRR